MKTLLFLSAAIFFPCFRFLGLNVTLLDFFPFLFLLLFLSKKRFTFSFPNRVFMDIYCLNIGIISYWLFSSVIAFFFMQDSLGFLKSMLQLYRRGVVLLIVPLFLLNEKFSFSTLTKVLTVFALVSSLFGELINFFPDFQDFYLLHIESSSQILVYSIFRNMGTIGEASYFAMIIAIVLLMNLSVPYYRYKKVLFLLLIFSLFSTASKSTVLAFVVSLTVLFLFQKRKEVLLFLLLYVFLLLILFYILGNFYWASIYLELAKESLNERISAIWNTIFDMFGNYSLLWFSGLGFKGLKSYLEIEGAHNMFLGSVVDFGLLFGIIYFPIVFIVHFVFLWKTLERSYKAFFVSMFSLLFIESVVHEPFYHCKVLALYYLLLFSLVKGENLEVRACS